MKTFRSAFARSALVAATSAVLMTGPAAARPGYWPVAGIVAGAVIGSAIVAPAYAQPYAQPAYGPTAYAPPCYITYRRVFDPVYGPRRVAVEVCG